MNVFKTEPGKNERILITEENYAKATQKHKKYCVHGKDGKIRYYAVCPICDNPIQIIGLYKKHDEGNHPYGKHHKGNVKKLADYNEEDYLNCPYSKPSLQKSKIKRPDGSKTSMALYNLLRDQYDRIIYILSKTTGIKISYAFSEGLLRNYAINQGWMYYDSTYDNLPYMLLYAESAYHLTNRLIEKNSEIFNAISKSCDDIELEKINDQYYKIIPKKSNRFIELTFYLTQHKFTVEDENLKESYLMVVRYNNKTILEHKLEVNPDFLRNLINLPVERSYRNEHYLEIAKKILQ